MKKFIAIFMAFCFAFTGVMMADSAKDLRKARDKQKKEKIKQFKKEGWTIFGSTNTIDVALLSHYNKLQNLGDDAHEVVGLASNFKSKNVGVQTAHNNACITYAQEAGSDLQGRVVSDIYGSASDADGEFDHFYAAYERAVQKEIRGELKSSFSIIHDNKDGTFDLQTFFIVDEAGARQARMRALEAAMKESEVAQKHADKISEFIKGAK
ncbi:MAG: hypothetical protein J6C44_01160 [Muribaculaceae bacterium]|nr:hypothetical protein [Muribaculaceae bacterium]